MPKPVICKKKMLTTRREISTEHIRSVGFWGIAKRVILEKVTIRRLRCNKTI